MTSLVDEVAEKLSQYWNENPESILDPISQIKYSPSFFKYEIGKLNISAKAYVDYQEINPEEIYNVIGFFSKAKVYVKEIQKFGEKKYLAVVTIKLYSQFPGKKPIILMPKNDEYIPLSAFKFVLKIEYNTSNVKYW